MSLHRILADPELTSELREAASKGELCLSSASFLDVPELDDLADRHPRIGCMPPGTPSVDLETLEKVLEGEGPERPEFPLAPPPGITEQVVERWTRPVVKVQENSFEETDLESATWQARLKAAKSKLETAIRAVGRIEVQNHPRHEWVGTGWLVADDIAITNRHVAVEFATRTEGGYAFRRNYRTRKYIRARIDFREEYLQPEELEFKISDVLYIEPEDGPDLAFVRVKASEPLPAPIPLAADIDVSHLIAVVGYPKFDSRSAREDVVRIFEGVYQVKRLAPGEIDGYPGHYFVHDCSTLGGCSGGVVLDMATGQAVGLHYGGEYLKENYAIPAPIIADRLARVVP